MSRSLRRALARALPVAAGLALAVPLAGAQAAPIGHALAPSPNLLGWNATPVTVTWTTEAPYGPAVPSSAIVAAEGSSSPTSVACNLLNPLDCVTDTASVNIDLTDPTISIMRPTGTHDAGQVLNAAYQCNDAVSGLAPGTGPGTSCAGSVPSSAALPPASGGTDNTFTVVATDRAGRVASASSSYRLRPSPPVLVAPAAGATTSDRTPEFRWINSAGSSIDHYDLYVRNQSTALVKNIPESACAGTVCETAVTSPDLGPPFAPLRTPLQWYVRAVGVNGLKKDSTTHRTVTVDPGVPSAPTLTGGPAGVTGNPAPTFSWNGTGPTFQWQVVDANEEVVRGPVTTDGLQTAIQPPLPDGAYRFEVRQAGANLVFGDAAVVAFTVDTSSPTTATLGAGGPATAARAAAPSRPPVGTRKRTKKGKSVLTPLTLNARLLTPKAGARITDLTPTLRWSKRPHGVRLYNVQVFLGTRKVLSRFPTGQSLTVPQGVLSRGRRYVWRVWPYFGRQAGYAKAPLGLTYLDVVTPAPKRG